MRAYKFLKTIFIETQKNPIHFSKFKFSFLVTKSTNLGNFLNNLVFLAAKYTVLSCLLSRLNSSGDTLVSNSVGQISRLAFLKLTL